MELYNIKYGLRFMSGWQSVSQNVAELHILNLSKHFLDVNFFLNILNQMYFIFLKCYILSACMIQI